MHRPRVVFLSLAAGAAVAAFAACTLNPQPLPPGDDFNGASSLADAGVRSPDSGAFGGGPEVPADAGTANPNSDSDGGDEAGDGGLDEAGDGGLDEAGDAG